MPCWGPPPSACSPLPRFLAPAGGLAGLGCDAARGVRSRIPAVICRGHAFAVWRHGVGGEPVGHGPALWSMVFPLGMYAAASASYGRETGLDFMVEIARVAAWIGFAAWAAVAAAVIKAFDRRLGTALAP
ncbi:hypothetical protein [Streptomyces sp. NPDC026673]|uniref:SLAC1 family transporter n=1 Tax=Streptomyces sp. NPDC026673 TaxID=3155724 RepID=UPI00340B4B2B